MAVVTVSLATSAASAEQPANGLGAAPSRIQEDEPASIAAVARKARPQTRHVHPDYAALSAGGLLFGLGYAIAFVSAARDDFSGSSGRLAIPLAGPWLVGPSWNWALDGLAQLGGVAFMVDGFANPVTVLGTPLSRFPMPKTGEHIVIVTFHL
ncbi:MAG: hypothetical protein ABI627_33225 [Polyangiaceae bacterium]